MDTDAPLRILFVEDVPADAELAMRTLRKEGLIFAPIRVETQEEFLKALAEYRPDLVISDYSLPQFDGMQALRLALDYDAHLPFIIVTGATNEETAVDCIKAGAWDYVLKERLTRLPFAVKSAFEHKRTQLARMEAETALRESERHYREIFNAANEAIVINDAGGRILDANDAMVRMYGCSSKQDVLNRTVGDFSVNRPPYSQTDAEDYLRKALEEGPQTFEWLARKQNGEEFWAEVSLRSSAIGGKGCVLAVIRDITERKAAEDEIYRLAYFDALTGLPNRRLFRDRLNKALAAAHRSGRWGAVLFVDLDQFKRINDARGHDVGDLLLKQVGARLTRHLRDQDTVGRQRGDEFVVLLVNLASTQLVAVRLATLVAEKIRSTLLEPFRIGELDYYIGASIGITVFPKTMMESMDDLLREADTAMYQAKEAGRNTVSYFEPAMQEAVQARFAMERDLREALGRGEMRLFLQSQVDGHGRLLGAEALVRWERPGHGLVSPAVFIPLAEESGIILTLGRWVLEEACRLLRHLESAECTLHLAANVSPRQFRQPDFVACIGDVLRHTGADPSRLILEITESLVIEDVHEAVAKMLEIKKLGVHFSIDDFGTGYSSLAYLKQLPLHEIKIDRTFVREAPTDPNDAALIEAILAVAQHLKLSVVAEGVETAVQLDFLKQRGCRVFQGYFFDQPLPWLEFREKAFLQGR